MKKKSSSQTDIKNLEQYSKLEKVNKRPAPKEPVGKFENVKAPKAAGYAESQPSKGKPKDLPKWSKVRKTT